MPASIILLGLAFFGVMKENRIATIFVMSCLTAAQGYFIYQLVYLHLPKNKERFINSVKYLTFFISVTMVLVLITVFNMTYCFRNYGKGLLISQKSKVAIHRRPFEIDEDPTECVPSIPVESNHGDDGATQNLMAYPTLKRIQETYHIKPADGPPHNDYQNEKGQQAQQPHVPGTSGSERSYGKMELE
ncbi:hypothetical protein BGX28_007991 [Mortierella sp. GBA30]|nr:hypothetical protein BGX28_007991 [Mortierella sp. GBA30]